MRTLRARLMIGTALGTGLLISASALVLYLVARRALWNEFDEALTSKARALAALVEQDGDEIELEIDEDSLPEYRSSTRAEYYQFWKADGEILARSASLCERNLTQLDRPSTGPAYETVLLPDGRPGRTVRFTFTPRREEADSPAQAPCPPTILTVAVARDTIHIRETLGRLRLILAGGCAGAILASVVVLSWFIRRGLAPLTRLATEIAAIGEADLSARLEPGNAPAELAPVVNRLNDLLARLENAFAREKAFTADVAHELRTPLAGLRSTLEVSLSKNRAAEDHRQALAGCLAISQQMQRLVENLLELARADAGQLELGCEVIDLVTLLENCWAQYAERAKARRLKVTRSAPESCSLTADPTRIRLVIDNLLDNAITYADAGGEVEITLKCTEDISLRVANTGSRVDEMDALRVFDRFWRGDAARAADRHERRYGLGLPFCQRLTTLLGGSIAVSTTRGGTFAITITLPRQPAADPAPAPAPEV